MHEDTHDGCLGFPIASCVELWACVLLQLRARSWQMPNVQNDNCGQAKGVLSSIMTDRRAPAMRDGA